MKGRRENQKGFTLLELMVVIAIIVVLAGVLVIPNVLGASERSRVSAANADITTLQNAVDYFVTDNEELPNRKDASTEDYYTLLYTGIVPDDDLVMEDKQDTDNSQAGVLDIVDFPLAKRDNLHYHLAVNDRSYPKFKEHGKKGYSYGWRESYLKSRESMRDPWDNSYILALEDLGDGTTRVFILSAGSDKVLDTDPAADSTVHEDDIGITWIMRP